MTISQTAKNNHEQLFPNSQGTLQITDPELLEIFENFTFDEVLREHNVDIRTRLMVILAACLGSQALLEFRMTVNGALNVGVTAVEIKEIIYQAVPYVGMAKVVDFLLVSNEIFESRGIKLPLESQATTSQETRLEKGLEVQKAIFGEVIDQMYTDSPANQIHIQKFLSANCFGDYITRGGIDIQTRELLTFSMLLSMGGCEPQLKGHIQGNLNLGNDKEKLISVVTQLIPYVGYPRALNALRCLNEAIPEA